VSDTIAGAWWLAVICAGTVIGIVRWVWGSKHVCAVDTLIVCSVVVGGGGGGGRTAWFVDWPGSQLPPPLTASQPHFEAVVQSRLPCSESSHQISSLKSSTTNSAFHIRRDRSYPKRCSLMLYQHAALLDFLYICWLLRRVPSGIPA